MCAPVRYGWSHSGVAGGIYETYVLRAIERMGNTINYYIFSKNLKIIINNQSCLKLTKLVDTESAAGAYSSCGGMRRSFLQIANPTGVLVSLNWHTRSERL